MDALLPSQLESYHVVPTWLRMRVGVSQAPKDVRNRDSRDTVWSQLVWVCHMLCKLWSFVTLFANYRQQFCLCHRMVVILTINYINKELRMVHCIYNILSKFISLWNYLNAHPFGEVAHGPLATESHLFQYSIPHSLNVPVSWKSKVGYVYFNKSLLSGSDNMLLPYIIWEPFHICSRGVSDEYIAGGSSRTWIQTTKESFLSNDFHRGKSPRIFPYQHFFPNICVSLWWNSPSILLLWFSEVNICNLKTVPIISPRASETTRCYWTVPILKCRTMDAFAWGRWAEFM